MAASATVPRATEIETEAVTRSGWSLERLIARARDSLEAHGTFDATSFGQFASLRRFVNKDYHDPATFGRLREQLGDSNRPLHYLAIPPELFETVVRGLGASGCSAAGVPV
jgi:glucose-6-phosphate 1-dehydrogenase